MTSVGIIGGLGPESTIDYYRRILEAWEREDPSTAPSIVIDSLDARRALQLVGSDRPALIEYLLASLRRLAGAGVDFAAITANTPHIVFDELAARSPIPLLSIVEVCAEEARRRELSRVALLGTRFTMEAPFYPAVCARFGIAVVTPNEADRAWVHERYVGELLKGEFRDDTRQQFVSLVGRLRDDESIDGVILGGTELPLLLSTSVIADVPALDTTALHVAAIVKRLRQPGAAPLQRTMMQPQAGVSPVHPEDFPRVVEVWEASVRATHDFVTEANIQFFKPLVRDALPHVPELACVRDGEGQVAGFIGVAGQNVDMLFIHPAWRGQGIGRRLMTYAITVLGATTVDVNEQNPQALGFYLRMGFEVVGRSALDGTGKPFPLLHLRIRELAQEKPANMPPPAPEIDN